MPSERSCLTAHDSNADGTPDGSRRQLLTGIAGAVVAVAVLPQGLQAYVLANAAVTSRLLP
jgi:hypothetical protein